MPPFPSTPQVPVLMPAQLEHLSSANAPLTPTLYLLRLSPRSTRLSASFSICPNDPNWNPGSGPLEFFSFTGP